MEIKREVLPAKGIKNTFRNQIKVKHKMGLKMMSESRAAEVINHWPLQIAVATNLAEKIIKTEFTQSEREAVINFVKRNHDIPKNMRLDIANKLKIVNITAYYNQEDTTLADKKIWNDLKDMKAKGILSRCK
jgi:hypothetical protein